MKDYFLSWGAIYIPMALVFFIFSIEKDFNLFFGIMALISIIMGFIAMRMAHKRAQGEDIERTKMYLTLIARIDELIDEIRQDRNERKRKSK